MSLSNTATPKYYGEFREAVIRGDIPVCETISLEMNRIDDLIANPGIYYDPVPVEAYIDFCECELTLTDGSDLFLLDSFTFTYGSTPINFFIGSIPIIIFSVIVKLETNLKC